jgi:hypothetical protein
VTEPKQRNFDAEAFLASAGLGRSIVRLKAREVFSSQGSEADSSFYLQRAGPGSLWRVKMLPSPFSAQATLLEKNRSPERWDDTWRRPRRLPRVSPSK